MGIHSKHNNTRHTSRMCAELITCEQRSNWGVRASVHADHPPEILHPYTSKRSAMPVSQVTGRIRTKRVSVGLGSIVLATSVGLVLPRKICEKGSKLLMENIELICRVEMFVRPWPYWIKKNQKHSEPRLAMIVIQGLRWWSWREKMELQKQSREKTWVNVWTKDFALVSCDETDFLKRRKLSRIFHQSPSFSDEN